MGFKRIVYGVYNELILLEYKSYYYLNVSFFYKFYIIVKFLEVNLVEFGSKWVLFFIVYVCFFGLFFFEFIWKYLIILILRIVKWLN